MPADGDLGRGRVNVAADLLRPGDDVLLFHRRVHHSRHHGCFGLRVLCLPEVTAKAVRVSFTRTVTVS